MSGHLMANAAFVELPRIAWAKLTLRQGGAALVGQSAGQARTDERKIDGGGNPIVARDERGGGLIVCSERRRAREGNPHQTALSRWATAQVCEVMYPQLCGDFGSALIGGEESAE